MGRNSPSTKQTGMAKLLKNDGGQGRNRTADASLFRAVVAQPQLSVELAINFLIGLLSTPLIGTLTEPQLPTLWKLEFASNVRTQSQKENARSRRASLMSESCKQIQLGLGSQSSLAVASRDSLSEKNNGPLF